MAQKRIQELDELSSGAITEDHNLVVDDAGGTRRAKVSTMRTVLTGSSAVGGDASGPLSALVVDGLQTRPVASTAPSSGEVLTWTGSAWAPGPGGGTPGGDLSGAISSATVVGLQTRPVANTAPSSGNVLTWNGSAWAPAAIPAKTLQQAYVDGATINVTAGEGTVQIEATTAGDATTLLTLVRNHTTGVSGKLIEGTMHTAATGSGIHVHQSAAASARGFHVDGVGANPGLRVEGSGTLDIGPSYINLASGSTWALQIGGTAKLALNATGVLISSGQKILLNDNGTAGAPTFYFSAIGNTHGFYALAASGVQPDRVGIAGAPGLMAAEFGSRTGASSGTPILSRIQFTDATTSTAGWTALELTRLGSGTGSGTKRFVSIVNSSEVFAIDGTGRALGPDGTNAAPTFSFLSDAGNGMYLSAADTVALATNGVLRLSVSTSAVISTLPLTLPAGAAGTPALTFDDPDSGIFAPATAQVAIAINGTARFTVTAGVITSALEHYFPDGNAVSPSISNTGDTNTGFLFPAADTIGASTGGTLRLSISTSEITPTLPIVPSSDNAIALGAASFRWSNVFATTTTIGDLVLASRMDVDRKGDACWILREGDDEIFAFNVRTRKKYVLAMTPVNDVDADDLKRMEGVAAQLAA